VAVAAPRARPARRPPTETASPARPRQSRRPRRAAERPKLARSVIWILVVAGLLAGIVTLQVAVLQLRMERGRLQSEIVEIQAQNEKIESQLSSAASVSRIEGAARGRLGLVEPTATTYLELRRER